MYLYFLNGIIYLIIYSRFAFTVLKIFGKIFCLAFIFTLPFAANAQNKDEVDVLLIPKNRQSAQNCKDFKFSEIVLYSRPEFPKQAKNARVGGTVEVSVKIDVKGMIAEIENITGSSFFKDAATEAASKIRFTPALCDGLPQPVSGLLVYNFIPSTLSGEYFTPEKIADFTDLTADSQFFEPILYLTEKKLAFGYGNKKFHPESPLTRGDFAQFLRLTLDLLHNRAALAKKNPNDIKLNFPYNPNNLSSFNEILNLKKNQPYARSVRTLYETYKIAFTDKNRNFQGGVPMTNNEVIELWTNIFGAEAVPVNFRSMEDDRLLTRGEFALFLRESLEVLTYKVLP